MKENLVMKDIQSAYEKMYDGMIKKDADILNQVLDESFVLFHMTGMQQEKRAFIRAVIDGTLNYYSAEHQSEEVTTFSENDAELDGRSVVCAAVFGGGKHTWRLRQKIKLKRTEEGWKITEAVASTW